MGEFVTFLEKCIDRGQEAIRKGISREEAADRVVLEEGMDKTQNRRNVLRFYEVFSKG